METFTANIQEKEDSIEKMHAEIRATVVEINQVIKRLRILIRLSLTTVNLLIKGSRSAVINLSFSSRQRPKKEKNVFLKLKKKPRKMKLNVLVSKPNLLMSTSYMTSTWSLSKQPIPEFRFDALGYLQSGYLFISF